MWLEPTAAHCSTTGQTRSNAPSIRPAANSTASSINPSAEPSNHPRIPRKRQNLVDQRVSCFQPTPTLRQVEHPSSAGTAEDGATGKYLGAQCGRFPVDRQASGALKLAEQVEQQ